MTILSPAFPSSGVSLSSLGASPKQDEAFPAVSAEANFGAVVSGAGTFVRTGWTFFAFFSCLAGSAAQVSAWLLAPTQLARTPIITVIVTPVIPVCITMTTLHSSLYHIDGSLIVAFEPG